MLAASIAARAALLDGDTSLAVSRLQSLVPSASRNDLLWYPPAALAGERFLLANILLARGDRVGAERIALQLAEPGPIVHLLYARPSLALLADAAAARGDRRSAVLYRERRARLVRGEPAGTT